MTTISVITPTFHREDLLARCVKSVLSQEVDAEIEHIVVNDYGTPLSPMAWMNDPRVTVLNTFRTERSVARNTGAALSRGDWLYFLDDDDYALPGGFAALLAAAETTEADHVHGGYAMTLEANGTEQTLTPALPPRSFARLLAGETLPPQASWLRRPAFFAVGGFDPQMVPVEDVDLFRRIARCGTVAGTTAVVAQVRVDHPDTTTTQADKQRRQWNRSMELALDWPDTLGTALAQTADSPYWRGRCARVYAGSAARRLREGQRLAAAARLTAAARFCRGAGGMSDAFWRGFWQRGGD